MRPEPLGSKLKFWFEDDGRPLLFKGDSRGTGEDWAEVVACRLCELLGIPHVTYELASAFGGGKQEMPGAVCENMARPPGWLVLGNQLLFAIDDAYPQDQRYHVGKHSINAVVEILRCLQPVAASPLNCPTGVGAPLDTFVGYVMLDAWIANQDRHHENWGAIVHKGLELAPAFDHGTAFACHVTDREREERMSSKDRNRTVAFFAAKARSAFYADEGDTKPLGTLDAFRVFGAISPSAQSVWLERLATVDQQKMLSILDQVPKSRMTETTKRFTLELLLENQRRLLAMEK